MSNKVAAGGSKRDSIKWTEDMDNTFIDAMLEQQSKGFRVDGTFTSIAYKNMLLICVEAFGLSLTKEHLKNRMKTLKSDFNACHELFKNKSGITWSSQSKLFEAESNVWDELIASNPQMKKWKTTPVRHYYKLEELFSRDRAIGNFVATVKEVVDIPNDDTAQDIDNFQSETAEYIDVTSPHKSKASASTTPLSSKRKFGPLKFQESIGTNINNLVGAIKENIQNLNEQQHSGKLQQQLEELQQQEKILQQDKFMLQEKLMQAQLELMQQEKRMQQERMQYQEKLMQQERMLHELQQQLQQQLHKQQQQSSSVVGYTNQEIFDTLLRIGVPEGQLYRAYLLLGNSQKNLELFFSVPEPFRLGLLEEMMK